MELHLTVARLKSILGEGECTLDDSVELNRIASLETATSSDLAIVFDRGDESVFDAVGHDKIKHSSALLIVAARPLAGEKNYFLVKDPLNSFQKLIAFLDHEDQTIADSGSHIHHTAFCAESVSVHPTAVVSKGALIGKGSIVGPFVFIGRHCTIGERVILQPGVKILDRCVVGDDSIIHAGAVIGSDGFGYQVTKQGLNKIPQIGIVRIGHGVEIGANCSIDRGSFDETVIGDRVKIDNNVHIAHNVVVGPCTAILALTAIGGSVKIGAGCQIGALVAIKDHATIGNGVKIVSKAGVMHDLNDGDVVAGIPAMPFGKWKRTSVIISKLPELFKMMTDVKSALEEYRSKKSFWKRIFS